MASTYLNQHTNERNLLDCYSPARRRTRGRKPISGARTQRAHCLILFSARFTQRNCSVKRVSTEDASCGCTEDSHGSRAKERMRFKPRQRHRRLHSTSGTAVYTDVVRLVRLQKFLIHGCHVFACGGKFVV